MDGQRDVFDFVLALDLHMTVEQMESTISNDEYLWWKAFYVYRAAQLELKNGE
jgi:hypothetical protein